MNAYVQNATSGFLVFLIALPLSLGISMASGFPPVAGVLTAIVGGLGVTHLGSAELTIKGPAAGLIVIALGAVTELGGGDMMLGYRRALAVGVVAAMIQILFAMFKAGRFAGIMPPSVVHGMLAAIGIIIIAKQTPVMLGVLGAEGEPLEMLMEIPHYIAESNPEVDTLGLLALAILLLVPRSPVAWLRKIPAPVVVLLATVPLAAWMGFGVEHTYEYNHRAYMVGPKLLVQLPGNLLDAVSFPDFSVITSVVSLKYIAMYALVGTVESLLSVIAVDAMDPVKRASDLDRDLLVTGLGNLVSSSIGGLPMISEIVRSRANIDAGATSRWSNFFHGLFLLVFVALAPGLLQRIPLAALAAMLIVTGIRLASPSEFRHAWHVGPDQFALFFTTMVVTLATDLLVGVAVGLALKLVLHTIRGGSVAALFRSPVEATVGEDALDVRVTGPLAFTNLLHVQEVLKEGVRPGIKQVRVDLTHATFVDHTAQERLESTANEWPDTTLEIIGLESLRAASHHPHAFRMHAS